MYIIPVEYNRVQGLYGDAVYVRCLVDFVGKDDEQLSFNRDDILFINNTMHHHKLGTWDAQCVNEHGKTNRGGLIPSKTRYKHIQDATVAIK